ncbi:MAG: crossover junction endodeoxyribonuclease RuvC [Opitutales bacterium]|nr:crossover junction endodeoxyribonuclease RuvC [Opitutales bacterium]MBT7865106.1 crossover junction endodeoxyribonuclease RuvC [Opitutales bacterium]
MARKSSRQLWKAKIEGKPTAAVGATAYSAARLPFRGTILGIDPSLRGTGLAVLEFVKRDQPVLLHSRTITLKPAISMFECLGVINRNVAEILNTYEIDAVAVEQTIYVQNFQTAQILGAARGAAIAAAAVADKPIFEYAPLRVKQAVVGVGRASKEQVARTVMSLTGTGDTLQYDESDAAAVAMCHAFTHIPESK